MYVTVPDRGRFHTVSVGGGSPIVLVHTLFTGSLGSWLLPCGPELSADHTVFAYDLRGHGGSARTADGYDVRTMVDDLVELTASLRRFGLAGDGWGAQVAARFALAHPDRVSRLALLELPLAAPIEHEPLRALASVGHHRTSRTRGPAPTAIPATPTSTLPRSSWSTTVPAVPEDAALPSVRDGGRRLGRGAKRMITELVTLTTVLDDLRAEAPLSDADLLRLEPPTLFVAGSGGGGEGAMARVRRTRPDADRLLVDGGPDVLHDDPKTVAWSLVDFFDDRRVPCSADPMPASTSAHPTTLVPDDRGHLVRHEDALGGPDDLVIDLRDPAVATRSEPFARPPHSRRRCGSPTTAIEGSERR